MEAGMESETQAPADWGWPPPPPSHHHEGLHFRHRFGCQQPQMLHHTQQLVHDTVQGHGHHLVPLQMSAMQEISIQLQMLEGPRQQQMQRRTLHGTCAQVESMDMNPFTPTPQGPPSGPGAWGEHWTPPAARLWRLGPPPDYPYAGAQGSSVPPPSPAPPQPAPPPGAAGSAADTVAESEGEGACVDVGEDEASEEEQSRRERRRVLNRMAAWRCRRRKLDRIVQLEGHARELRTQAHELGAHRAQLRQQIQHLKECVRKHIKCGCIVEPRNFQPA